MNLPEAELQVYIILLICCDPEDRGIGPACYKVLVKSGGSQEEIRAI